MEDFKIDYHSVQEVISVVSEVLRMKNIGRNKGTNHEVDISCEDPGVKEEQDDLGDVGDTDTPKEDIEGSEGSHGEITTKMSNAGDQSQPNSHAQFYSSLVKLRGLDLLLQKHTGNNEDKRGLIDSYLKEEDMSEHIVHGILSFIHQEFFFPSSPLKKAVLLRMKKAISLLVELMNKQVLHPVMKNSSNLCEDFLTQVSGQLMTPFRQILLYSLTVVQVRHQNLFPTRPPQLFPNYQQLWKKLGSGFSLHQSCS